MAITIKMVHGRMERESKFVQTGEWAGMIPFYAVGMHYYINSRLKMADGSGKSGRTSNL